MSGIMKYLSGSIVFVVFFLIEMQVSSQETKIKLTINEDTVLAATLVDNSSADALVELLQNNSLTIQMSDYGNMEKVGSLGTSLPRNDELITTEPGDIILYQGSALVIYYAPNSWDFTRLGKIDNITQDKLKSILGDGDVTVKLEIADSDDSSDTADDDSAGSNSNTTAAYNDSYQNNFRIYPNPAKNYIEVSGMFEKITMFDIGGRILITTQNNRVELNDIASGTYFLKIESKDNKAVVQKFVKKS